MVSGVVLAGQLLLELQHSEQGAQNAPKPSIPPLPVPELCCSTAHPSSAEREFIVLNEQGSLGGGMRSEAMAGRLMKMCCLCCSWDTHWVLLCPLWDWGAGWKSQQGWGPRQCTGSSPLNLWFCCGISYFWDDKRFLIVHRPIINLLHMPLSIDVKYYHVVKL